jgi:hypothetical protein
MNKLKKLTIGFIMAAIISITSFGTVDTEKQTVATTTQTDPGGGGWQIITTPVASGDPGGGGWEPVVAPDPDGLG